MPQIRLTQQAADRLKPAADAVVYWDTQCPGFGVRVSPKGRRTWIAMYRVAGKPVMETIGTAAQLPSVSEARELARQSIVKARQGVHPVEQRKAAEQAAWREEEARALTFSKLVERYMREYAHLNTKASTAAETWRLLRRAEAAFGNRAAADIRKIDIVELISARRPNQFGTAGLLEANHLLSAIRRCFKWAVSGELVESNPTDGVLRPLAKEPTRDRCLTDEEIVAFWRGCEEGAGWPFGPAYQLLLLTAQRLGEVAGMRWSELDLPKRVWNIPGSRTKNSRPHTVHLGDFAMQVIQGLPQINGSDFVFTMEGDAPVQGFAYAKERVDRFMPKSDWRLHDLRRTATTGMARLGIPPHVADRVLNHQSGTIRGVAAVYNRFAYLDERRDALDTRGRFVERCIKPEPNVVKLPARRRKASR